MAVTHANDQVSVLARLLRELHLPMDLLSLLVAHAQAVLAANEAVGLVATADEPHILSRHTADSLLFGLARPPRDGESWVDVGSGAGFPGFVLACCYPNARFTLVEALRKRAGFLEMQRDALGLDNVEVINARAEGVAPGFHVAIARALAEPLIAIEALRRLIVPGGTVLVAVGPTALAPSEALDLDLSTPGVDSPGRLLMIAESIRGA